MSDGKVVRREKDAITRKEETSIGSKLFTECNKVVVSGRIEKEFEYSHKTSLEKFYQTEVAVTRYSGVEDVIPIVVSDSLIEEKVKGTTVKGKWIEVAGQFRSHQKLDKDGHSHLELFLFGKEIKICDKEDELEEANVDLIYLDGYLGKPPVLRETPSGRKITDLLMAVNRPYGKSDYIPCIAWGKVAQLSSEFEVGKRVKLYGRIQRREYFKRYSPDSEAGEYKHAYEISIMRVEEV